MRTNNRQRVGCQECGWSGGRADGAPTLLGPCSKCGGSVELLGAPYVEQRVLAGCASCRWWGERTPKRVTAPCPKCERPTQPASVVTLDGLVLA